MPEMERSRCCTSYAFVSQIIKDSMAFVKQHSRPCSQPYRPQTGHSELSAKLLNAKQLRSDRGNWISVTAKRFGSCTEAWCFHRFPTDQTPHCLKEIPSVCWFLLARAACLRGWHNDCPKSKVNIFSYNFKNKTTAVCAEPGPLERKRGKK